MDESQQTYEKNKQILSHIYTSKKNFINQYKKFYKEKPQAKELYLQILTELEATITVSNIDDFENLSKLICYIGNVENSATLQTFYDTTENPIKNTNLVILACKHNTSDILQYIFDNTEILNNFSINIGGDAIAPIDEDESCHNAFYYAIRSGNLKLVDTLISKWPNDYFIVQKTELDEILSRAYEELKIKNVTFSDEIEHFIENKLINLRFFSTGKGKRVKACLSNIKQRVDLVLENINLLLSNAGEVDDKFLLIAKFVAQNIHILKRQIKSTYTTLPWEEIEFCLIAFINSKIVRQEINLIYNSVLTKKRILLHLENFAKKLQNTEITEADIKSKLPKLKRENVITSIISDYPRFEELYNDFEQVKDIYSLEKIAHYIELASTANAEEGEGQLIIARALQITGEYLKNSLESPNISDNIKSVLLSSVFHQSSDEVVQSFRDVLSHFYSLKSRIKFEESEGSSYFSMVQSDLNKIKVEITYLLEKSKAKVIRVFLKQFIDSNDLNAAKTLADTLIDIMPAFKEKKFENAINTKEFKKLEDLLDKLDEEIDDKTPFERKAFDEIRNKIYSEKNKINDAQATYSKQILSIANIADYVYLISKSKGSKSMKNAKELLIQYSTNFEPFIGVPQLICKISKSIFARKSSASNIYKISHLITDINLIIQLEMCEIKGIEELKNVFTSGKDEMNSFATEENFNAKDALYKRLGTLRTLLNANGMVNDLNLIDKFPRYKKDKQFQLMVEMLVLDIMEILQHLRCLGNNLLFVDTFFPILVGRSLRNHLAHGNSLIDVLQFDADIAVLSNALKLILEEENLTTNVIGSSVLDDITQLNKRYNYNLTMVTNQLAMFEAARQGDIDNVKNYISKGADVTARDINKWTVFHYAAAGGSLEAIKFFLPDKSLDINARDKKYRTPLHIAASYGRENIVHFFLIEKLFSVNTTGDNDITALHMAAENGHREVVKILLKHKVNAKARDSNKLTPLYVAARAGHQDVVQLLLFNKPITDDYFIGSFFTPLHIACLNGHLEVVNILLVKKANINAKMANGMTPLSCAAQQGHNDVVKMLLACKADVNCQSVEGYTAFIFAVACGNCEVVKTLLPKKSKFDMIYYWVALHEAAQRGYCDIVDVLLKNGYKVDSMCEDHVTALQLAAKFGHFDIVQLLIDNKAKINTANKLGYTALHNAAEGGHNNIVKYLLNKGANVNTKTTISKATPLHSAALCGHIEVANTLIQYNADINFKNVDGSTPICIAAEHGHDNVVKALLSKGAKLNDPDNNKWTPLHYAVYDNRLDVVKSLLSFGVNTMMKSNENNTPVHLAAQCGFLEIVKVLLEKTGVNIKGENGTPLHSAVLGGHLQVVQYLLKNKADVNARDEDDWTPLRLAVQKGYIKIVRVLLANGANINVIDKAKYTPLILAALGGKLEICSLLLAEGADINCVETNNNTPLHLAAEIGKADVVEILLKNGARINAQNKNGLPPVYAAVKHGYIKVVEILLQHAPKLNICKDKPLLHLAVANGFSEIIEMLLAYDRSIINETGTYKLTALHAAVGTDKIEIVNILLRNGANINIRDSEDRTPLFLAVHLCRTNMIEPLIAAGGNVNDSIKIYAINQLITMTLLHAAAGKGNKKSVEILLKNGASIDIDNKGSEGVTPLIIAAEGGHEDIVKMLLYAGANVNICDDKSKTPLLSAVERGYDGIVRLLLEFKAQTDARLENNTTALHCAAFNGHENIIEMLLNAGSKIDEIDSSGWTALHHAAEAYQEKAAEILLLKGANVNFPNKYGRAPLHVCSVSGSEKIIELLLRNQANVNAIDTKDRITPLYLASVNGNLEAVVALLNDQNININAVDDVGRTALHAAVFAGHKRVTKTLLNKGAQFDVQSLDGLTPLQVALKRGHFEIANRLKLIESLFVSISENNLCMVEKCIADNVLVNCKSVHRETSLYAASLKGNASIVRILLENKANVHTNGNNMTPLHVAANIETVQLLLKYGALYNIENDDGKTPLNLSKDQNIISLLRLTEELFEGAKRGNENVISKLRSANPDEFEALTNARNKEGLTILLVAITNQRKQLARDITDLFQAQNEMQSSTKHESVSFRNLLKAIESNNRSEVANCIRKDTQAINSKDTYGRTPLHYVVSNGNIEILNTLLLEGADATQITNKGNTILHTAASKNYIEIVEVLLRLAKRNNTLDFMNVQTNVGGATALHVAATNGFVEIVETLLKYGAAYNIKNINGKTPLNVCKDQHIINLLRLTEEVFEGAKHGNYNVISKLKSAKPHELEVVTKAHNMEGKTLLAISDQHKQLAREITDLLTNPIQGNHLLLNQSEKLKGPSELHLERSDSKHESASFKKLLKAIESNNESEVAKCIREDTKVVNLKDTYGRTPLHYVVSNGNIEILNTLLLEGADATQITNKGNTILHTAASKNYKEIVQVLLRHAERNNTLDFMNVQTNVGGATALHVAATNGFVEIVKTLLKYGAAYNIENSDGKTPLNLSKDQHIINLLRLTEEVFEGAKHGNDNVISKLRSAKPDELEIVMKASNKKGMTLLSVIMPNKLKREIIDLIQNPNHSNHLLNQLKKLKDAAQLHLEYSFKHLSMLHSMCIMLDLDKTVNCPSLREGSHFLLNAYNLVKTYKKSMPDGKLADKNIQLINSKLVELQFHPKHILSGENYSTMSIYYFASKGQGTLYYNMLVSGLKKDIVLFMEMVERDINAPTRLFLESVEQKLQSLQNSPVRQ